MTGLPGSSHDGKPYYLMIQGGPGFYHVGIMSRYEQFASCFGNKQEDQPHFIYFDPLGCGESDSPADKDSEYTVDNFTEIAASLIEAIKQELKLSNVDLRVFGESFGGMVAMNLPTIRPNWTLDDSSIRLKQIVSSVGLSAPLDEKEILAFIKKHYQNDPNYHEICASISKLLHAEIADREDYIRHIAITLAPLYSDQNARLFSSPLGRFVKSYPMLTGAMLESCV